jgi:predicted RNase H-like nuclease (RuvC/YqgF family)
MSVEFSNAYQEILFENLVSIIKQNFVFQTQLKISEDTGKQKAEIQSKYDELLNVYTSVKGDLTEIENLKAKILQNDSAHQEKQRIQTALNAQMKENLGLKNSLEQKELEIVELKNYITKLEEIAPISKLKKINPEKKIEEKSVEQPIPAQDLFAFKVDDGSSF